MHNFYLYRGREFIEGAVEGITACALPVVRLTEPTIYHGRNHVVWADNFFQTIKLGGFLLQNRKIHCGGTVQKNRIPDAVIPKSWWYTKSTRANPIERGDCKCKKINEVQFIITWYDKRPVNLISTISPAMETVKRWQKDKQAGTSQQITVSRPNLIRYYNAAMGGTDSFDQRLSYYRPNINTKKWPHRVFFHFLLCCVVNAHILYKYEFGLKKHDKHYGLFDFMNTLVDELSEKGKEDLEHEQPEFDFTIPERTFRNVAIRRATPTTGHHFPISLPYTDKETGKCNRRQCVLPDCGKRVLTFCEKCNIPLCIDHREGGTCWRRFHATSEDPYFQG